ncbi:MAG TPA: dienelactone hydrolase family protein [Oscillatoriaceae cyanobacterium]
MTTARDLQLQVPNHAPVNAYEARPQDAGAPGVVVIHEAWGVDKHIRDLVDRLAADGYAAIAPNLLGMEVNFKPEVFMQAYGALQQLSPEERAVPEKIAKALEVLPAEFREPVQKLMGIVMRGATPEGLAAIDAAIAQLRQQGAKKVAVIGFCMGGAYSWAAAYHGADAEAFAPFYGRVPENRDASKVRGALEGHYGGQDHGIPVEPIEAAAAELRAAGKEATIFVYPDAGHAFLNDTRDTFNPDAAKLSWERLLKFFERTLR